MDFRFLQCLKYSVNLKYKIMKGDITCGQKEEGYKSLSMKEGSRGKGFTISE